VIKRVGALLASATVLVAASGVVPVQAQPVPTQAPPRVTGLAWHPAGRTVGASHPVYLSTMAKGRVGLMWLKPSQLTFRYIPGYKFPENSPIRSIDRMPSTWVPRMAAAFNGGFHLKDDGGGYFYDGQMVKPLRSGLAQFTITKSGQLGVSVGKLSSSALSHLSVVRQNLPPLVLKGKARAYPSDSPWKWGAADRGLQKANRSALGQLADGSLVFAYGSNVEAYELARSLAAVGVRTAVMLDMNKSWPMGFVYDAPRGGNLPVGHPIQADVWRDASAYYNQFSKDFVVADIR